MRGGKEGERGDRSEGAMRGDRGERGGGGLFLHVTYRNDVIVVQVTLPIVLALA